MIENILPNLHRIEVPLPKNPLKAVNCYVITSDDRNLIIDSGADRKECREALESGLAELNVDMSRTDFFITHMHSDHIGLVSNGSFESSTIYFNRPEAELFAETRKKGGFGMGRSSFTRSAGFSEKDLETNFQKNPGLRYHPPDPDRMTILDEGDQLNIGEYTFECILTPGHSPGHTCLYDGEKKLMICSDHVLNEISPNISTWRDDDDPLTEYYASLEKVRNFDVELALPGHRGSIRDFKGRVDELKYHHDERIDEVLGIIDGSPMHGYDIAARMTWNMKYETWDDVGMIQQWFATGEAVAHLRHLETAGRVRSEMQDEKIVYTAV